jgi:hypothetical protein
MFNIPEWSASLNQWRQQNMTCKLYGSGRYTISTTDIHSQACLYITSILFQKFVLCNKYSSSGFRAFSLRVLIEADRTAWIRISTYYYMHRHYGDSPDEWLRHRNMTRAIPFIARKAPIPNYLNFRPETERASCPLIKENLCFPSRCIEPSCSVLHWLCIQCFG